MVLAFHQTVPATDVTQKAAQSRLNDQHRHECIQKRGLDPDWIEANCRSVTSQEATQWLGFPATSAGILNVVLAQNTEQQKKELFGGQI